MGGYQFDFEPLNTTFGHSSSESFPSIFQSIIFQLVNKDVLGDAVKHLAQIRVVFSTVLPSSTKQAGSP